MQVYVPRPSGACGAVCVCEDFGAETGFAKNPANNSEVLTEHSLCCSTPGTVSAPGKRLYMDNMLEIRLGMWVKKAS